MSFFKSEAMNLAAAYAKQKCDQFDWTMPSEPLPKTARAIHIINVMEDIVYDFLVHNRKYDEQLPRGSIEEAIKNKEVTIDEVVEAFKAHLTKALE